MLYVAQEEMVVVGSLPLKQHRKLLFTMFAIARHNNAKNSLNNSWINYKTKDIFKMADVKTSIKKQNLMLYSLYQLGYVEYPKNAINLNVRLKISNDIGVRHEIPSVETAGLSYLKLVGEPIKECLSCHKMFRVRANAQKYCCECSGSNLATIKYVSCLDCARLFEVSVKDSRTCRCEFHRLEHKNKLRTSINKRHYNSRDKN